MIDKEEQSLSEVAPQRTHSSWVVLQGLMPEKAEMRSDYWHIRMVSCSRGTEKRNRVDTEVLVRFPVTSTGGPETYRQ